MTEEWVEGFLVDIQEAYPELTHLVTPAMDVDQWVAAGRPRMWSVAGTYSTEEEGLIVLLFDTGYGHHAAYKAASKTVVMFHTRANVGEKYTALAVVGEPYVKLYKEMQAN